MTLDLRIGDPCSQRWGEMAPAGGGQRWCERRVTDFRGMSDDQVELAHARSPVPVCGVYDQAQLRPDAPPPAPPRSTLVTLALGATLLGGTAAAQGTASDRHPATMQPADAPPRRQQAEPPAAEARPASHASSFVVRGTVRNAEGRPLPGAVVVVDGRDDHAQADSLGVYELHVKDRSAYPSTVRLRFARLSFAARVVEIPTPAAAARVDAVLEFSPLMLGGVVYPAIPTEGWWMQTFRPLLRFLHLAD